MLSATATNVEVIERGDFIVKVEGIKKVTGNIGILVFAKGEGFPDLADKALFEVEVKVTSTDMKIKLEDIPYGDYAIALVHDVNANDEFDKNILGIPKEPFGFSNNKSIFFGLPDFKEAAVSFDQNNSETIIRLIDL